MRTMLMVWVFMSVCLGFGCITNEPTPNADKTSADGVGQVEQDICLGCNDSEPLTDCDCPLGTRASGSSCVTYAVFGPLSNPCVASCQCYNAHPGQYCTGGPYPSMGQCAGAVFGPG